VPIDHVNVPVSNLEASRAFYTAALAPFGYKLVHEGDSSDPDGHNIEAVYHGPRR
jgi:catechol 2,3-dioxygenase-like lactoylglutathione lyase family enzyme